MKNDKESHHLSPTIFANINDLFMFCDTFREILPRLLSPIIQDLIQCLSLYLWRDQCRKSHWTDTVCYRLWRIMSSVEIGPSFTLRHNSTIPATWRLFYLVHIFMSFCWGQIWANRSDTFFLLPHLLRWSLAVFANKQAISRIRNIVSFVPGQQLFSVSVTSIHFLIT